MRMYIPRKPHAIGVKLCVLADSTTPYVIDMYIYKGKCRLRGARRYKCASHFTASEITNCWANQLPRDTILVCDSFFGSHKTADSLASRWVPFLFLVPKIPKARLRWDNSWRRERIVWATRRLGTPCMPSKAQPWVARRASWCQCSQIARWLGNTPPISVVMNYRW